MVKSDPTMITVGGKTGALHELADIALSSPYEATFVSKRDKKKIVLRLTSHIKQNMSDKELILLARRLNIKLT